MSETTGKAVTAVTDADGVCLITMDLPGRPMNVLGPELVSGLAAAIDAAAADPAVKGIVLASGKPAFIAGADLKGFDSGTTGPRAGLSPGEKAEQSMGLSKDLRRLETCGKPVACAVNGTALGGGFEVALACHYRVVADDPRIRLGLPEATIGLLAGAGGTQRLPRLIGVQAALPLLLRGTPLTPAKALEAGLIHAVVPAGDLVAEAKRWVREEGDPVAPWDRQGYRVPGGDSTDTAVRGIFSANNAIGRAATFGNQPAQEAIAAAVYEGVRLPFDSALKVEAKYFVRLLESPVSKALIKTMFVNKGKADKLEARPAGVEKAEYTRIGLLGAGTMGAGLALAAAAAGLEVVLLDRDQAAADKGRAYAEKRLARDVEKQRRTREKADEILARIRPTASYEDLADVQIVVEAVFESREAKRDVIARAEAVLPPEAVFATNTSALPITELAEFSARPERFIGMHFFSPAERMPLVEIIRGERTSDEALAHAMDLARALRKTPVLVNDNPGFFTTRFIGSFVSSSLDMINEGVNPNLVENAARALGMPMGVMAISDSMGLDLSHQVAVDRAAENGEPEPDTGIIGRLVVEHGRHGVKNGKGFYDHHPDGTKDVWPGLFDLLPESAEQLSFAEVKQRILYAQLAEGARAFAEGVLASAADGDLGAILGVGFPAHLGGPFFAIDTIGLPEFVAECDRLTAAYGDRYAVPELLRDMAKQGQTFHGPDPVTSPGARGKVTA